MEFFSNFTYPFDSKESSTPNKKNDSMGELKTQNRQLTKVEQAKVRRKKLPRYVPPETVSECPTCNRTMNNLLLRFKVK